MCKQIKECFTLFGAGVHTALDPVIHCAAVIDNGVIDIPARKGGKFTAIGLVLQSCTTDGLTTDGIEVIVGQERSVRN